MENKNYIVAIIDGRALLQTGLHYEDGVLDVTYITIDAPFYLEAEKVQLYHTLNDQRYLIEEFFPSKVSVCKIKFITDKDNTVFPEVTVRYEK